MEKIKQKEKVKINNKKKLNEKFERTKLDID